jgi:hypothetical protein
MYQLYQQHLDSASGFHVIELRDEHGNKHLVQIAVGHDSCPACGHVHLPKDLDALDSKAMVAQVIESLNQSHADMHAYAQKHGLQVK